jgi:osmoprotectant transport system permease protein
MSNLQNTFDWLTDPANWTGSRGIPVRLLEHIQLSLFPVLLALIPALLVGLYIGHTRRFEFVSINVANLGRAIPSFAWLALLFPIQLRLGLGFSSWATIVALFFLAIPPILTNTHLGVREVDSDLVEAARGMGMSGAQILGQIEMPLAIPFIVAGVRTALVQVIATATLAALIAGGGLGRFIVDGFALGEAPKGRAQLLGGAILIALLAITAEISFAFLERLVSPRTASRRAKTPTPGTITTSAETYAGFPTGAGS